jgi:hypothetical protein
MSACTAPARRPSRSTVADASTPGVRPGSSVSGAGMARSVAARRAFLFALRLMHSNDSDSASRSPRLFSTCDRERLFQASGRGRPDAIGGCSFAANSITKMIGKLQPDATSLAKDSSTATAGAKMSAITHAESSPTASSGKSPPNPSVRELQPSYRILDLIAPGSCIATVVPPAEECSIQADPPIDLANEATIAKPNPVP